MADAMQVDGAKEGANPVKVKADDDPEAEGEWMRLSFIRFKLTSPKCPPSAKDALWADFMKLVERFNSVAVYEITCQETGRKIDSSLVAKMKAENERRLKEVDDAIKDAQENEGDMEVRDGMMAKAQVLARTATKELAANAYDEAEKLPKTTSGQKLDVRFHLMRIGMFWGDIYMVETHVKVCKELVDNGGDWERRNRLKVYEASYLISIRDFKRAATLLLESISTFTAVDLYSYNQFYTVVCATIACDRKTIKEKVIHAPEILQVIASNPALEKMINSLYKCLYKDFFVALVDIVDQLFLDRFVCSHARYFLRQARVVAYTQYLESYHTVDMASMSATFGVGLNFLDNELSDLVACGRLSCKIDKVKGVVCSNRPDRKNALYQQTIKQGDSLLNRIQKLSRVITI
ncbi:26S proteasome regulatory complex, subunit RPN7 [Guillardia theta CCMP2712]|uniref:26S proteasome regulatory complex, subunit RPN7 n=1 Tax=Guillardia theta (strain CCMP2712) TaxID=905079 RepID=L1JPL4_GUITC|nr:26S proteasome regulatory complex, subunit RPN7 [Guillardia theta CCMP2712]EKX50382.1 26S proteasome regulatory complex, subunit RPN7 [Guillardia theta CCMP2712]|eukprot:XP_005837362.1 26S proteasome regulatory complex, subunit RPN7 [Guillardia theta CCMP2712]